MRTQVKISELNLNTLKENLTNNGFIVTVVEDREQAKAKALELVPKGAEIFTATSVTLDTLGLTQIFNKSGDYNSVKAKLMQMDRKTESMQMQKMGAAPEYAIGSVHALTEDGHALIASATGSQLPAYVYGAGHVVWVVGIQKFVKDIQAGIKRVYDVVLPLESERARKAYGVAGSSVNKLLIYNKEATLGRVNIILVKEALGF